MLPEQWRPIIEFVRDCYISSLGTSYTIVLFKRWVNKRVMGMTRDMKAHRAIVRGVELDDEIARQIETARNTV